MVVFNIPPPSPNSPSPLVIIVNIHLWESLLLVHQMLYFSIVVVTFYQWHFLWIKFKIIVIPTYIYAVKYLQSLVYSTC